MPTAIHFTDPQPVTDPDTGDAVGWDVPAAKSGQVEYRPGRDGSLLVVYSGAPAEVPRGRDVAVIDTVAKLDAIIDQIDLPAQRWRWVAGTDVLPKTERSALGERLAVEQRKRDALREPLRDLRRGDVPAEVAAKLDERIDKALVTAEAQVQRAQAVIDALETRLATAAEAAKAADALIAAITEANPRLVAEIRDRLEAPDEPDGDTIRKESR